MKQKLQLATRLIFGLAFLIFGLNGFLQFMQNPPVSEQAGALLGAFGATGYFFPLIKSIEVLVGLLLLSNFLVPFAIVLITPILVGITSIHLFLNPAGLPMMIILHTFHGFLVYSYRKNYQGLFERKASL